MNRSDHSAITYPPELLPRAAADEDSEVVLCCGEGACASGRLCPRKFVVLPYSAAALAELVSRVRVAWPEEFE